MYSQVVTDKPKYIYCFKVKSVSYFHPHATAINVSAPLVAAIPAQLTREVFGGKALLQLAQIGQGLMT
jgi:hypothetical protein